MPTPDVRVLNTRQADFELEFQRLLDRTQEQDARVEEAVQAIIAQVRERGDSALIEYTRRLDRYNVSNAAELEVPQERLEQAATSITHAQRAALEQAAARIRSYHQRQVVDSWRYYDDDGTLLGQQVTPLARIGIYVPGGKAAYPSSLLMNAIPAEVAGVAEIIMAVPAPAGKLNDMVLTAAKVARIDRIFTIGGAQAVAALAYGTETIPRVDKIVGPGNVYVAAAKRLVFGHVDIDMIAGPSEVTIVCDGRTDPAWVAMDLFGDRRLAQAVQVSDGALITATNLDEAIDLVNRLAPEHLELSIEDPLSVVQRIHHAGAIFMGRHTAEVLGDYCAGPNHVLPTSGTARFRSPLGVYDFQKRTSLIMCTKESAAKLAKTASVLARGEGFPAHARSAEYRIRESSE